VKILVLADIHQREFKWSKLASAVHKEKPDAVCIAGDLIPNSFSFDYKKFIDKTIRKYAKEIKNDCPFLFVVPGNDDNGDVSEYLLSTECSNDLWYNVHNRVVLASGLEFAGIPYVIDHPFGYKYWSVRETNEELRINSLQLSGPVTTVKDSKGYVGIEDYAQFLMDRPSMETYLQQLSEKVSEINKSIFLIHCPPIGCGLDVTSHGDVCGSNSVTRFIMDKQPLITVHGHIHESPHYTGRWCCQLGNTWAINAGQIENDLYYVVVEVQENKVIGLRHSIYGEHKL